ncbi:hypothetical protein MtrunA17_Chr3g0135181 [Medicago truncatula]|uniref:Transmembrane protein, putative n=1 Tax=Medicago truncatula TaxID=3880 RepID=A0A072V3F5_MEDTR|nr:transmembrane protein, putative [Medicago truncatula]RHN70404.1 hypothetical protein MtrunA17_Chr3g0135181 [Medicago truncatula]
MLLINGDGLLTLLTDIRCGRPIALLLVMGITWIGVSSTMFVIGTYRQRCLCLCDAFIAIDFQLEATYYEGI